MKQKGQSLIEIVVALGLFTIIAGGIITLVLGSLISVRQGGETAQATFFMQEGAEAVRNIRDQAWNKLAFTDDGQFHGLDNSSGTWDFSGINNILGKFTRSAKVESVTRDGNGNIGAGANDLETKKITVNTAWSFALGRTNQAQSIFYLTNWNRGLWKETTVADFNDGTLTNTQVTNDTGGEIKLAASLPVAGDPYGNSFLVESTSGVGNMDDAQKWTSLKFTAQATKTVSTLRIYVERENGISPTYRYGLQTDSGGNPSGTWLGATGQGYGDWQATTESWQTINLNETVNLTSGSIYHLVVRHQLGTVNPGRYVSLRKSNPQNLRIPYNNATDSNSNVLWTENSGAGWIAQNAQSLYILGYNDGTFEGDPYYQSSIAEVADTNFYGENFTLSGGDATVSNIGFYTRKKSAVGDPQDDLHVVLYDVTTSTELANKVLVTIANITTTFAWHEVSFDSPIILTNGHQYRIYLSSPATPLGRPYQIYVMENTNAASDNSINYLGTNSNYIYSNNSGVAWTIQNYQDTLFRFGTLAGGGYQSSGTYESSNFGSVSNFNLIKWTEIIPGPAFDLKVQIKTAPDSGGAPGAWSATWSGPEGEDGDETDYFTNAVGEIIHPDHIGDNWIKYRLTLSGDGTDTPVLQDITINYKP